MDEDTPPASPPHLVGEHTQASNGESSGGALKPVLGIAANVTVLTALLIYFGWQRSATQSARLGISESIFGASARDYVLRSVESALVLLIGIGAAGLLWVMLDWWLVPLIRADRTGGRSPRNPRLVWMMRILGLSWIVLPVLVALMLQIWGTAFFYILFPVSIATGVLLLLYAAQLRQLDTVPDHAARRRNLVFQFSGALLVGVCLFWTAARYAEVEGNRLAREMTISSLPGVTIHSQSRLHLDGPGVEETELSDVEGELRYRYTGLRLLEYADSKYFLVSDGWTREYGVVFVMPDGNDAVRFDFVRDSR